MTTSCRARCQRRSPHRRPSPHPRVTTVFSQETASRAPSRPATAVTTEPATAAASATFETASPGATSAPLLRLRIHHPRPHHPCPRLHHHTRLRHHHPRLHRPTTITCYRQNERCLLILLLQRHNVCATVFINDSGCSTMFVPWYITTIHQTVLFAIQ